MPTDSEVAIRGKNGADAVVRDDSASFRSLASSGFRGDAIPRRRRTRFICFVALESIAITLVLGSVVAGLSEEFAAESLTPIFRFLPIGAAAIATILPILFFGSPYHRRRRRYLAASGSPMHSYRSSTSARGLGE
jgi:hypothetical protein